jgi:hypothetical protein
MTIRVLKMAEQDEREIEWIEPAEAADIMGVSVRTVQNLCAQGKPDFRCKKWGRSWMVDKECALAYEKTVGGRPRKVG